MIYHAAQIIKHHLFNTSLPVNLETILKNELILMNSKNSPHFYYFLKCCTYFFTDENSLSLNGLTCLKQSNQGEVNVFTRLQKLHFSSPKIKLSLKN